MKQNRNREIFNSLIIVGDVNFPLSIMERTNRQKLTEVQKNDTALLTNET